MIGRLRDALGRVQLILDMPARLQAVEQENAELLGRIMDIEKDLDGLEAITRELYVGPTAEAKAHG